MADGRLSTDFMLEQIRFLKSIGNVGAQGLRPDWSGSIRPRSRKLAICSPRPAKLFYTIDRTNSTILISGNRQTFSLDDEIVKTDQKPEFERRATI